MKFLNLKKRLLAGAMTAALAATLVVPVGAVNSTNGGISDINPDDNTTSTYTYQAPTEPMAVDENIVTASAHRAASPLLGMMGVNATSGFGMINGGAPSSLASAQECAAMGIWGSSLNSNPDPYYWNYFYNFYANETEGVEPVAESVDGGSALTNKNVAASPAQADGTLFEEYGNVSVSLATRPDILVGCAAKGGSADDVSGYDEQLATIRSFTSDSEFYQEGDESYDPQLVSYQMTTIKQMIESVQRMADAITAVEEETGKTTRYGDVQEIASDYETYIYGIISYVQEELAAKGLSQKTFAYVTGINEDGTFQVGGADYNSATSLGRAYEYCIPVATPLTTETKNVTLEELKEADVIITLNNQNLTAAKMAEAGISNATYDGVLITNNPASLYGITMNSVENAVGYAYVIGSMYADELDIDPVELCAYFYEKFEHITDQAALKTVVLTNFSDTILPEGVSATLSSSYSTDKIEAMLVKGMNYYTENEKQFDADQYADSGINDWAPDYNTGIGAGADPYSNKFTDVATSAYYYDPVVWALKNGITEGKTATTFDPTGTCTRGQIVTFLYRLAGSPSVEGVENPFTDVKSTDYYYDAVLWAVQNKITDGRTATTFAPKEYCKRSEIVTFLYRYEGEPAVTGTGSFTDVASGTYYYDAVLWAVQNKITEGTTATTFAPNAYCKRGEAVTFLYRDAA
jgi:hypothetical protein